MSRHAASAAKRDRNRVELRPELLPGGLGDRIGRDAVDRAQTDAASARAGRMMSGQSRCGSSRRSTIIRRASREEWRRGAAVAGRSRRRRRGRPQAPARPARRRAARRARRCAGRGQHRQRQAVLLGEERLHHVLGDRRGRRAVLAVLGEDHAGDLRIVTRREEHEPAVVAGVHAPGGARRSCSD